MRQLIKRILREEIEKDLSYLIEKLLNTTLLERWHVWVCGFSVAKPIVGPYKIVIHALGGLRSEHWPVTQFTRKKREDLVNDVWNIVYNYLGVAADVNLEYIDSCDKLSETSKQEQNESELTERCWKGYTQKGMKTMFGKRYPNCVKVKKKRVNESETNYEEEIEKDLSSTIEKLLNTSLMGKWEAFVCGFSVTKPTEGPYKIVIHAYSMFSSERLKRWPITTQFASIKKDDLPDDVWKTVYNYLGIAADVNTEYVDSCDEILKESLEDIKTNSEKEIPNTPSELIKSLPQELKKLLFKQWGAKQNPTWHPEGNSLKHIIFVLKRAYHHYPDDPNMILAALFHDLGKMDTYNINPKTGQPTAYGHEDKSTEYVEEFRDWISSFKNADADEIKYLVKNHMKIKGRTWDSMRDVKKEKISSNPAFDKLKNFTDKLDLGGNKIHESKIIDYLKKFVDFKSNDPQKEFQKVVDIITKITKKDNPVDGMIGVAVTQVNKEIWGQNFNEPDSLGSRWDFKVIVRPLFPQSYVGKVDKEQFDKFKDEFLNNAKAMGMESTSPITHKKVNDYTARFIFTTPLWTTEM